MTKVVQGHGEKTRIHQVQDAVFCTADVHVGRQPFAHEFRVPRLLRILWREVAQEVPGRVEKVVTDVSFAPGWLPTDGTGRVHKVGIGCERRNTRAGWHPVLQIGQKYWQLVFGNRNRAVFRAVNDRNRRTPVTLAADEPVAQTIFGHELPTTSFLKPGGNLRVGLC